MLTRVSGYVPFYNNRNTIVSALQSLADQSVQLVEVFGLDDASTDGGDRFLEVNDFPCLHHAVNLGRGAARHRATIWAKGEIIACCDATNVLPDDFVRRLLPWFDDPKVAAVYGRIQDPNPTGVVARWRARHLFKAGYTMHENLQAPLITYGTLMRRSAVLEVGNFNPNLRHSEDKELGDRLLAKGYKIVFDPSAAVFCNVDNSIGQVLERYWRWHAGSDEAISLRAYLRNVVFSLKFMVCQDLRAGDPFSLIISLICPHVQFWTTVLRKLT
jgi:biofilm PGA synthesis N-glycosyltransferase PgaC